MECNLILVAYNTLEKTTEIVTFQNSKDDLESVTLIPHKSVRQPFKIPPGLSHSICRISLSAKILLNFIFYIAFDIKIFVSNMLFSTP